jgi:hypothetical protein
MRIDYVHSGTSAEQRCALVGVTIEGPWPGPVEAPVAFTDLGPYVFEVRDAQSGGLRFAHGFASVFGEWQTIPEARTVARAFSESLRFPEPPATVDVILKQRDAQGALAEVWRVRIDPRDPAIDRASPPADAGLTALFNSGLPSDRLDLLLLGDGYTAAEMEKFRRDARRMAEVLFSVSPFKERRADFNVWALASAAQESGVSRPSDGIYRRSPLRVTYDALGMERYVLSTDEPRLREVAARAPYEALVILVNERKYGGGGVYGLYATVAVDNAFAPYILVHELAHHLAGLADEYFASAVTYQAPAQRVEPWEPNVTADPQAARWRDLVLSDTPLPTPWPKKEYEHLVDGFQARRKLLRAEKRPEAEMEALFSEERASTSLLLRGGLFVNRVGAFEGAMYESSGLFRPALDCVMFSRNALAFCPVCRRAIERAIDLNVGGRPPTRR